METKENPKTIDKNEKMHLFLAILGIGLGVISILIGAITNIWNKELHDVLQPSVTTIIPQGIHLLGYILIVWCISYIVTFRAKKKLTENSENTYNTILEIFKKNDEQMRRHFDKIKELQGLIQIRALAEQFRRNTNTDDFSVDRNLEKLYVLTHFVEVSKEDKEDFKKWIESYYSFYGDFNKPQIELR